MARDLRPPDPVNKWQPRSPVLGGFRSGDIRGLIHNFVLLSLKKFGASGVWQSLITGYDLSATRPLEDGSNLHVCPCQSRCPASGASSWRAFAETDEKSLYSAAVKRVLWQNGSSDGVIDVAHDWKTATLEHSAGETVEDKDDDPTATQNAAQAARAKIPRENAGQ